MQPSPGVSIDVVDNGQMEADCNVWYKFKSPAAVAPPALKHIWACFKQYSCQTHAVTNHIRPYTFTFNGLEKSLNAVNSWASGCFSPASQKVLFQEPDL